MHERRDYQPRPQGRLGGQNCSAAILNAEKTLGTRLRTVDIDSAQEQKLSFSADIFASTSTHSSDKVCNKWAT